MATISAGEGLASLINFLVGGTASAADAVNGAEAALGVNESSGSQQTNNWGATLNQILGGISASTDVAGTGAGGLQMLSQFAADSKEAGALLGEISSYAGQLGLVAAVGGVVNTAYNQGWGAVTTGQLESVAGAAVGLVAVTAAAPEVAIALGVLAAGLTTISQVSQSPSDTLANVLPQLQNIIQPYFSQLSNTDQTSFSNTLSSTVQSILSGGMMVPQVDSSGQITGYAVDIPTTVAAQSDGSTLYTFATGITYLLGCTTPAGPLSETSASGSENIWTFPATGALNTQTLSILPDGSYSSVVSTSTGESVSEVYIAGSNGEYTIAPATGQSNQFVCTAGSNDLVTAAAGSMVALQGSNDAATVSNATIRVTGSGAIDGMDNSISLASGGGVTVSGSGNSISQAASSTLTIAAGDDNTISDPTSGGSIQVDDGYILIEGHSISVDPSSSVTFTKNADSSESVSFSDPSGDQGSITIGSNGQLSVLAEFGAGGVLLEEQYFDGSGGLSLDEYFNTNGTIERALTYTNGVLTNDVENDANGSPVKNTGYYASGSLEFLMNFTSGSLTQESEWDSSGNQKLYGFTRHSREGRQLSTCFQPGPNLPIRK